MIVAGYEEGHYTRSVTDRLITVTKRAGYAAQVALLVSFASDPSAILSTSALGQAGCIVSPTKNAHEFEIVLDEGLLLERDL